jgi:exodeoxyribonuclease V alpha subunit
VTILTGGPGTGKTHSLRAVLALARAKGLRCLLAAPTGRAAKRMEEATGQPAGTLHRVLELRPGGQAGRGLGNPLPADLVVVDEVSMLDALLANQLGKAIAIGTHLLLVGDPDQLPSVGAGDVLADLLRAGRFPVTRLDHIFRQGAGSGIAANAQRVKAGALPRFGGGIDDCFFLPADDPAAAARLVVDLVARRLPARYGFGPSDVQVLAPMHRGAAGTEGLNRALQAALNPDGETVSLPGASQRVLRVGDKVMQVRNDYERDVFNGDVGVIVAARRDDEDEAVVEVEFDGRRVRYEAEALGELELAYAVSVHKSQGSEYPAVVVPLLMQHYLLLQRNLLYTAVTRGKKLVVLVGSERAIRRAVSEAEASDRHTGLRARLHAL